MLIYYFFINIFLHFFTGGSSGDPSQIWGQSQQHPSAYFNNHSGGFDEH